MFDSIKGVCLEFFSSVKDYVCEYAANTWSSFASIFTGAGGYGPISGRIAAIFSFTSKLLIDACKVILVATSVTAIVVALVGLAAVILPEIAILFTLMFAFDICASTFHKCFNNAQLAAA
jgi:hypothetical protein